MEKSFATIDQEDGGGNFNNRLNSTACADEPSFLEPKTPKRGALPISPIPYSEGNKTPFGRRMLAFKNRGESPLVKHHHHQNAHVSPDLFRNRTPKANQASEAESGYSSHEQCTESSSFACSSKENHPKTPVWGEGRRLNPFDSRILGTIHSSVHSPNLCDVLQSPEEARWAIEHRASLCPANITEEEIRLSRNRFIEDPEFESRVSTQLEIYWGSAAGHVPSPDGPPRPFAVAPSPSLFSNSPQTVASAPYSVAKPVNSRRRVKTMRNTNSQTEMTIPPNFDFDFAKILGEQCVYDEEPEEQEDEFNVSVMNTSLPRKLFAEECSFISDDEKDDDLVSADPSPSLMQELGSPTRNQSHSMAALDLSPIFKDE